MNFDLERIERRVKAMPEGELLTWLGVAIPGMQRHLETYERSRNLDHLGELAIAEMTANVVITELLERRERARVIEATVKDRAHSAPSEHKTDTDTGSARRRFRKRRAAKTGIAHAQREDTRGGNDA